MTLSENGIQFLETFEGFSPVAYKDVAGYLTIGYGTLIDTADEQYLLTATITREQAEELLRKDVAYVESQINLMVKQPINQNQYNSLVSFAYNLGATALRYSTLMKKLNINPNDPTIRAEFNKWVYAGGVVVQGLVNRRQKEADLYFTE